MLLIIKLLGVLLKYYLFFELLERFVYTSTKHTPLIRLYLVRAL